MAVSKVDIIIFGGGIAGLWTLNRLLKLGYSAVLLELQGLGGVQTIASQGIIHGGTKYALTGSMSDSARQIGAMPGRWRDCLTGQGELDLSDVQINAEHQYLWSTESLASKLTGFFAGKVMQSRMKSVKSPEGPALFNDPAFKGSLYRLDEPVLDVPGLAQSLVNQANGRCYHLPTTEWQPLENGRGIQLINGDTLEARSIVLTAGSGNEALLKRFGRSSPVMQRRPLHMPMARGELPALYAHCLGVSANPRITITSHRDNAGWVVWNIGGQPAEGGNDLEFDAQVTATRKELASVLPWVDFSKVQWSAYRVDRAEIAQPGGKRPDSCYVSEENGIITAWPTKLAFAPLLADQVCNAIRESGVMPSHTQAVTLPLNSAPMAMPPWETAERWT